MRRPDSGGGWPSIKYVLDLAARAGWARLWRAVRTKNACKTCALGMGGQRGAMRNEAGHWPEICKKSFQAMAADMQGCASSKRGPRFFWRSMLTASTLNRSLRLNSGHMPMPVRHLVSVKQSIAARSCVALAPPKSVPFSSQNSKSAIKTLLSSISGRCLF